MNRSIREMFDRLARVYELINHIVSLGLDISWRKRAASLAAAKGGTMWLDVSTGTGEMAAYLRKLAEPGTTVVATDFSMPMLIEARRKEEARCKRKARCTKEVWLKEDARGASEVARKAAAHRAGASDQQRQSSAPGILFAMADTGCLPFRPNSFDLVTISLATRNITTSRENLVSCLREFNRVLKPGGWFVNLETSQPDSPTVRRLFHKYVDGFLRPVGAAISGSKGAYTYLSNTIRTFYEADELTRIIREAGFENVSVTKLFLGVAAIHEGEKRRR
jgi:demethylmenaquinone methyltransferase / 2-methoxy-6-polyprenyl-1,4-benzoquinol methylase